MRLSFLFQVLTRDVVDTTIDDPCNCLPRHDLTSVCPTMLSRVSHRNPTLAIHSS